MIYVILLILLLIGVRKYLPQYKLLINRTIIGLSIWLVIGTILGYFLNDSYQRHYSDAEYAQVFIKDHPELKATWKQLSDGRIRIKPRKGKPLFLKDGVVTRGD